MTISFENKVDTEKVINQTSPKIGSPCRRCSCSTGWNPAHESSLVCHTCGCSWSDHL